ncbi:GNAT family N-acetyltransferase [Psychrobacillus sp.]|uniref:GNAT family N-acetyltransferase n=1 Tax=Psychrobacillus sp. TaxID=1871623 RepID=UPI0028BE682A|nr:GNAT family N-acetyltransferase [Psychrobacillus sp.]
MSIRKATLQDLDSLTELFDLYRIFYRQDSNVGAARNFIEERLRKEDSVIFIAYEGDSAVGFVQLYPSFSSVSMKRLWILNDLYVTFSGRGKGFGDRLIKETIAYAEQTGAKGILLETEKENIPAQKLYEKIGFHKETNHFYFFSL